MHFFFFVFFFEGIDIRALIPTHVRYEISSRSRGRVAGGGEGILKKFLWSTLNESGGINFNSYIFFRFIYQDRINYRYYLNNCNVRGTAYFRVFHGWDRANGTWKRSSNERAKMVAEEKHSIITILLLRFSSLRKIIISYLCIFPEF